MASSLFAPYLFSSLAVSSLESELQEEMKKRGLNGDRVYFNKGLWWRMPPKSSLLLLPWHQPSYLLKTPASEPEHPSCQSSVNDHSQVYQSSVSFNVQFARMKSHIIYFKLDVWCYFPLVQLCIKEFVKGRCWWQSDTNMWTWCTSLFPIVTICIRGER